MKYNRWIDPIKRMFIPRPTKEENKRFDMAERTFSFPKEYFSKFNHNIPIFNIYIFRFFIHKFPYFKYVKNISINPILIITMYKVVLSIIVLIQLLLG